MSKAKFYSMTKPIPFRKIRLFLRLAKERITSVIYNILYRLNIIEKYSFSDVMRNGVPVTIEPSNFESGCISATLEFTVEHTDVVNECYYHKKGNKLKKLYVIMDSHLDELHISAHMTDIGIKMPDGKFQYVANGLPEFRVFVQDPPEGHLFRAGEHESVSVSIKRIDVRKLRALEFRHSRLLSAYSKEEIETGYLNDLFFYVREQFTQSFIDYFREVKLYDLFEED